MSYKGTAARILLQQQQTLMQGWRQHVRKVSHLAFSLEEALDKPRIGMSCLSPGSKNDASQMTQSGMTPVGTRLPASPMRAFSSFPIS